MFAALNAGLTTSQAAGSVDLGDWSRLLMGVSALLAGALFDLHDRSYMNITMTCTAMLSALSFFVLLVDGNGGNALAAIADFLSGFGLLRGVFHDEICCHFGLCALVVSVAVHGPCHQQRLRDVRDGAGGGDCFEPERAAGGGCRARAVCGYCDFTAGTVWA